MTFVIYYYNRWNASLWALSFFVLIGNFLSVYNEFLLLRDVSHADVGKDCRDVSLVQLESHDPLAKSLHSIMNESIGTNGLMPPRLNTPFSIFFTD
jgi:hypothetical protein